MPKLRFTPEEEAEATAWFNSPEYEATKFDEIFTHIDHAAREIRHFHATFLNRDIISGKAEYHVFRVPKTKYDYNRIVNENGVEEPRVARLTYGICRRPILIAQFPGGQMVIVDGNHRIVRRYREGFDWTLAFFVEEPVWRKYLVKPPRVIERLKVEDTINAQVKPHDALYGLENPIEAYTTITG